MRLTETVNSSKKDSTAIICIVIVIAAGIAAFAMSSMNDRNNMAKNIDTAIQKGVDPISVKCAYETNPTSTCLAYALGQKR
jgi:hypothetical protein